MSVRVDKWLWAVRVYKSRAMANEACAGNRVFVNGEAAKPATKVDVGDTVEARRRDRVIVYKVIQPLEKRVGASLAAEAVEDLSPPAPSRSALTGSTEAVAGVRDRGAGRPTKRDRRRIQQLRGRE